MDYVAGTQAAERVPVLPGDLLRREAAMTGRQRNRVVEARADLILGDEHSAEAYAAHFETQMHGGKVRRLLYLSYQWFARTGTYLAGLGYADIQ
jgi:hypothetical protein